MSFDAKKRAKIWSNLVSHFECSDDVLSIFHASMKVRVA